MDRLGTARAANAGSRYDKQHGYYNLVIAVIKAALISLMWVSV